MCSRIFFFIIILGVVFTCLIRASCGVSPYRHQWTKWSVLCQFLSNLDLVAMSSCNQEKLLSSCSTFSNKRKPRWSYLKWEVSNPNVYPTCLIGTRPLRLTVTDLMRWQIERKSYKRNIMTQWTVKSNVIKSIPFQIVLSWKFIIHFKSIRNWSSV